MPDTITIILAFATPVCSVCAIGFWKMHGDISALSQEVHDLKEVCPVFCKRRKN
ncbi:MAG: hypothetical protein WCX64_04835 [Candidatus Micrarchaeia archaeon]|jgi:predicted HNH restriction endonuclease